MPLAPRRLTRLVRIDWLGGLAGAVLVLILIAAVFGPLLTLHDPMSQNLLERLNPPAWEAGGSWAHPLGTDSLGRDVLSRLIVGARLDIAIALATATAELLIGVTLGIIAGYAGGKIDTAVMGWTDIQMGFPAALIVLFTLLLFGPSAKTIIIALSLNGWMIFTRLIRGEVQRIKNQPFVHVAVVSGASTAHILVRHVIPHLRGRVTAIWMLEVPRVILASATLSFVGLGIQAPQISWGLMIADSRDLISVAWWPGVFPGIMIVATVASMYVFASWLEPRIDPLRDNRRAKEGVG